MINVSELYRKKDQTKSSPMKTRNNMKFNTVTTESDLTSAKQRADQIKKNTEGINKIIRQKKFYLKHKPIFDTVQEENEHDYVELLRGDKHSQLYKTPSKNQGDFLESSFYLSKKK